MVTLFCCWRAEADDSVSSGAYSRHKEHKEEQMEAEILREMDHQDHRLPRSITLNTIAPPPSPRVDPCPTPRIQDLAGMDPVFQYKEFSADDIKSSSSEHFLSVLPRTVSTLRLISVDLDSPGPGPGPHQQRSPSIPAPHSLTPSLPVSPDSISSSQLQAGLPQSSNTEVKDIPPRHGSIIQFACSPSASSNLLQSSFPSEAAGASSLALVSKDSLVPESCNLSSCSFQSYKSSSTTPKCHLQFLVSPPSNDKETVENMEVCSEKKVEEKPFVIRIYEDETGLVREFPLMS